VRILHEQPWTSVARELGLTATSPSRDQEELAGSLHEIQVKVVYCLTAGFEGAGRESTYFYAVVPAAIDEGYRFEVQRRNAIRRWILPQRPINGDREFDRTCDLKARRASARFAATYLNQGRRDALVALMQEIPSARLTCNGSVWARPFGLPSRGCLLQCNLSGRANPETVAWILDLLVATARSLAT
jgi:hypothetical protein